MITFNEMPIDSGIKKALEDMGFENPTPIQEEVIPLIIDGSDVIAQAPTGTGKTCAFGIPIINNINTENECIQALILCPTRELVIQTESELKEVAKYNKEIRIASIYGGQNFDRQLAALRKKPQIIVGTTGRVMDHLRRKSLKLESLNVLILDEVDEMLDMGFREDIDSILKSAPKARQTVLFSATLPKEIIEISKLYQTNPISVKTLYQESDIPSINQFYVPVSESEKANALISIMRDKKYNLVLVFCNTKKRVDELSALLSAQGMNADALHGDLRQRERDKTMQRFRGGQTQMLIATDVAARGIDVDNIEAIFNFDIPHDEEYYVHRIGRTARANKLGDAYTFATEKQMYAIKSFERFTKSVILKADFTKTAIEKKIDKKLFDKTLKIVKRSDLSQYKDFINQELEVFKQKYEAEILDIAAALLLQINEFEQKSTVTLSEPPRLRLKKERTSVPKNGVKFFMNIGTRDNLDPLLIANYISTKTEILIGDIDVKCLENYSFATVPENHVEAMESLNGLKFNKRFLAVEVADSGNERTPSRKFGSSNKDFAKKYYDSAAKKPSYERGSSDKRSTKNAATGNFPKKTETRSPKSKPPAKKRK